MPAKVNGFRSNHAVEILHLEDSDLDADFVRRQLENVDRPVIIQRVVDRSSFIDCLNAKRFEVILSDYQIPGFDGLAALEAAREIAPETPFIFVSGAMGEEFAIDSLKRGATDYLLKDRLIRLPAAVERALAEAEERQERRNSHRALQAAEERFHFVRKSSGIGFWYCDLPFDVLEWDETVKAHFHLPPESRVSIDDFYGRLHPEDRQRTRDAIEQSIRERTPYRIDYRTVSPEGSSIKWIRAIGRSTYNDDGQPVRFDGITIDLSDRVAVEEQVREQAQELEALNRVGRSMAAELDLGKLVQSVTDAGTELTGAEVGAFFYNIDGEAGGEYSLSCVSRITAADFATFPMPRATEIFAPTFRGEGVVRLDDVTRDPRYGKSAPHFGMPKGHVQVRSYLAAPVISRSGKVFGGLFFGHRDVGVFCDRSERIVQGIASQAAIAIDNAYLFNALTKANSEKDSLLASERAARTELERASRMKDEFLATLSHELRTPLNAILGWAQVLKLSHDQLPADMHDGVDVIERNARAQTQIIDDLLDMNRIISGRIRLDVQLIELGPVIQAALETVLPAANAREIQLRSVVDPQAGPISADPNRLQQVFWNLLMNAVKFTPRGGKVRIVAERVNSHVEVSVSDTGEGIEPEFLPLVFDRFKQADASTTRRHGGLGLGLAIVKQLVELHGGAVSARSPGHGQGSTFTVSLPLSALHSQFPPSPARRHPRGGPAIPAEPAVKLNDLRILVVDDEPDARSLMKRLLESCGANATTAASAAEAFGLLEKQRFDVLVSDIGMPREDGYSLVRKLRGLSEADGGRTPAIALTAYARAEDRVAAIVSGFRHHLSKPVEPAELIAVIASLAGTGASSR